MLLALLQSEMDLFVPAIFTFVSRHLEDRQGSTEGLGCCYNMTVQNNKNIKEGGGDTNMQRHKRKGRQWQQP